MQLVECVPNFSEGRDIKKIEEILNSISSVPGVSILDKTWDKDHNRSVITFVGSPDSCLEAAFRGCKKAQELIDINKHKGEHPRIGATDVIPFVPLENVTMKECVEMSEKLGAKIWEELRIPVYLYAEAAKTTKKKNLANIRRGEFEGFKDKIKSPEWYPDFGEPEIHPTAGVTVVGARELLIAYNINLSTDDVQIAKKIAKQIRATDGGFKWVKSLGFQIERHGRRYAQVSMNITNHRKTSIPLVFETIKLLSAQYGTCILNSEVIGLLPLHSLLSIANFYLKLENFNEEKILEHKINSLKGGNYDR